MTITHPAAGSRALTHEDRLGVSRPAPLSPTVATTCHLNDEATTSGALRAPVTSDLNGVPAMSP